VPEPRPSPKPWLIVAVLAAALLAAVAWLALRPPSVAASRDASVPVASVPSDAPQTDAAALPPPPPPRDAAPPPDAASAVHHAAAPLPYCICLPVRPPTSSMCKVATAPRCRCISNANEVRLCPDAFELCNDCTRTTGSHYVCPDTRCDRDYGMLPCSDPDFAKLHALGHKHDEPCDGFPMFRNSTRIPGHYSCSYCDVAFSYRGHDGEPCKGFRFESGDPSEGHLDHCTLTPPRE
jgi:hypothetical protein